MLIFAIDSVPQDLQTLHAALAQAARGAEIRDFSLAAAALETIACENLRPDIVFTEIPMPELDGLALAARLRQTQPSARIVFVTSHPEYALEAFRIHADGYVPKPVDADRILEEMTHAFPVPEKLVIRCFGPFEVFWQNKPLLFARRKTKEMLAYLVSREGAVCTMEEMAVTLWEDETDLSALKHRLRELIRDLRKNLAAIGMEDVILRRSGQLAIRRDLVDCDYYRMLEGDTRVAQAYRGEYMSQYSWAEETAGRLLFKSKK